MRHYAWQITVFLVALFMSCPAFAERGTLPPGTGAIVRRDASSTNIPTTYTTGAGFLSSLSGKSNVKCCTTSTTDMAFAFSTATNCASATDNGFIPAASTALPTMCVEYRNLRTNSNFCVRSQGSAISSGITNCTVW